MIVLVHSECNTAIYEILGGWLDIGDKMLPQRFRPLNPKWKQPQVGDEARCPYCGFKLSFGNFGPINFRQEYREDHGSSIPIQ